MGFRPISSEESKPAKRGKTGKKNDFRWWLDGYLIKCSLSNFFFWLKTSSQLYEAYRAFILVGFIFGIILNVINLFFRWTKDKNKTRTLNVETIFVSTVLNWNQQPMHCIAQFWLFVSSITSLEIIIKSFSFLYQLFFSLLFLPFNTVHSIDMVSEMLEYPHLFVRIKKIKNQKPSEITNAFANVYVLNVFSWCPDTSLYQLFGPIHF